MVNKYNVTKLTLDSVLKNIGCEFNKFIIIASGTTELKCLDLLAEIKQSGYGGFPKEKFEVVRLPPTGFAESINLAITMLDPDEDLFCTPNNNIYTKNFMLPLLEQAYGKDYSEDLWMLCGMTLFTQDYPNREAYELQVRPHFLMQVTPEEGYGYIQRFFQSQFKVNDLDAYFETLSQTNQDALMSTLGVIDSAFYIKRECLNRVGFFDERFSRDSEGRPAGGGEEREYVNRISMCGKTTLSVKACAYLHIAYGITSRDGERDAAGIESGKKLLIKYDARDEAYTHSTTPLHRLDICTCPLMPDMAEHYVLFQNQRLPLLHSVLAYE